MKGAVPDGTVLWPKDRKNGNKHTIRFKFADEKANGENGWYTVKLKDRDNLFAVIRQDVDKGNYYANIYFEVDYEMPDEWQ